MSYQSFATRVQELWWLYQLSRASSPLLELSSIGLSLKLSDREPWAKRAFQKALSGVSVGVDDIPVRFLGAPPETDLPEELKKEQTYRGMYDFGQEMNKGRVPEIIFTNIVFAFESEIRDLKGAKPSPALAECFMRRHKYAHSGGIADQDYLNKLAESPLKDLIGQIDIGNRIPTTDEVLLESVKILLTEAHSFENETVNQIV